MEPLVILVIAYALTLAGLVAGLGRGHAPGTMVAACTSGPVPLSSLMLNVREPLATSRWNHTDHAA